MAKLNLTSREERGFRGGGRPAQGKKRNEGAAMILVMMLLLAVTGLATFSVQSTSLELRAAGHSRIALQADYVAEAGIDSSLALLDNPSFGPHALHRVMIGAQENNYRPTLEPFEPDLAADKAGYRIFSDSFTSFGGQAPTGDAVLGGTRQPYTPRFEVDLYDYRQCEIPIAGEAVGGRFRFACTTITSRGRMRLRSGDYTGVDALVDPRQYHEASQAARAYAIVGPF